MRFGDALNKLLDGETEAITRSDWYGSNASPVVKLQRPDENSKMTEPYLYMEKFRDSDISVRFPLDLSCESILSDKWEVVMYLEDGTEVVEGL